MEVERLVSLLGLFTMMVLAWLVSDNRWKMNLRLIVSGVALQLVLAVLLLRTGLGQVVFTAARVLVGAIGDWANEGAKFVFSPFFFSESFGPPPFAFSVLSIVIFVSSVTAVLFHLGVLQFVVKIMARIMARVMNTSGSESLCASANVFLGMTTAPLAIGPYLDSMTRSELMAMMTGGMATVAGAVMVAYAGMGADPGHLMAASLMSAPASLVIAKIMVPELEKSPTMGCVTIDVPRQDENVLDAACRGAGDGLKLALNIGAMLIAFIAIVAMLNWTLALLPPLGGSPLSLERILGWACSPLAWIMGVQWQDAQTVGMLIGKKTVLNEFLAYMDLMQFKDQLSPRSFTIATYALCGFANFGSIAVMIGGVGGLAPRRRSDFAKYGFRSMIGGALAAFMTASIAGMLI